MIRKVALVLSLILSATYMFAQSGRLSGMVTDKSNNEEIPFANVVVSQNGIQKMVVQSDFDGSYVVSPLNPGKYDIVVSYTGYTRFEIKGVIVNSNKTTRLNLELSTDELQVVEVYAEELIEIDKTTTGMEMTAEQIQDAPTRSVAGLVATGGGITQTDDGGAIQIAGSRSSNTQIIVNGVKLNSSSLPNLPANAIGEIQVMTGGIPAQYGDVTGGIINITTKVGADKMNGGFEVETMPSILAKPLGGEERPYNQLFNGSLSGPILTKTVYDDLGDGVVDTVKETTLGFFLTGQYQRTNDTRHSVIKDLNGDWQRGIYVVKDDALDKIREEPLVASGNGYLYRAETLTQDDLEIRKVRPNSARQSVQLNGTLEYYPTETSTLTLGGSLDYSRYRRNILGYRLMNSDNNPLRNDVNYNIFAKYRQTFGATSSDEDNASLIKNAYYQVQMDYVVRKDKEEDDTHKDNYFRYGHVGSFDFASEWIEVQSDKRGEFDPNKGNYFKDRDNNLFFFLGYDDDGRLIRAFGDSTLNGVDVNNIYIKRRLEDGGYNFTESQYNPYAARYVSYYQEQQGGDPFQIGDLGAVGLFTNGQRAREIHDLWFGPGRQFGGYTINNEEQYRLSGLASADVGKHNLTFGFEYEQRNRSSFFVSPLSLWSLAGSLTNTHLTIGSIDDVELERRDGDAYITFKNLINEDRQTTFDRNLRERLGITDLSQQININSVSPDDLSLDLFTANDLIRSGNVNYIGYNYLGERERGGNTKFEDFFFDTLNRPQASFRPIYTAFFIQDKFEINDLILRLGLRVDRYDANQVTLKDKYSTVYLNSVQETDLTQFSNGDLFEDRSSLIQDDWKIYVDKSSDDLSGNQESYTVLGFRDGDDWYDVEGNRVRDYTFLDNTGEANPWFTFAQDATGQDKAVFDETKLDVRGAFEDYKPQINVLPRISFSFPVNEMATFYANYDVKTQRPDPIRNRVRPSDFYFLNQQGSGALNNANLRAQRDIMYQLGFKQALDKKQTVSMEIQALYTEKKDYVQYTQVNYAYPAAYNTFDNVDFGSVKSGIITFDTRRINNLKFNASYTIQFADGTGSDATTAVNLVSQFGNLKVTSPLNFDQRHAFKFNADFRLDSGKGPLVMGKKVFENFGVSLILNAGSGTPYTKNANSASSEVFLRTAGRSVLDAGINSSRLPWNNRVSLRVYKDVYFGKSKQMVNFYVRVQNLLNSRNILEVYRNTGSATDDGFLSTRIDDPSQSEVDLYLARLANPAFYSIPRRVTFGATYYF